MAKDEIISIKLEETAKKKTSSVKLDDTAKSKRISLKPENTIDAEQSTQTLDNSQTRTRARSLPPTPHDSKRLEIPPHVAFIAEKAQRALFVCSGLYMESALFQAPEDMPTAVAVMRSAVTNDDSSTSTKRIYFVVWAQVHFFKAEMAALGYRFLSVNVKHVPKEKQPLLHDWLEIKRSNPRARSQSVVKKLYVFQNSDFCY